MVAYVTFNNVSFSISDYFKLIVQLWTCRNKHLILSWVFMTNNIVNSELTMSTAKGLCYMAPPALVSKCQPRIKWWKTSVRPTLITTLHPTIFNRFYSYQLQLLLIFWDLAAQYNFWIHTDQCGGLLSLPLYNPHYSRDRIDILHSHYPEWEHEPFWLGGSLFPFSRILWNFEILWIHNDWCFSLDSFLPYTYNFPCILFIFITAIGLS